MRPRRSGRLRMLTQTTCRRHYEPASAGTPRPCLGPGSDVCDLGTPDHVRHGLDRRPELTSPWGVGTRGGRDWLWSCCQLSRAGPAGFATRTHPEAAERHSAHTAGRWAPLMDIGEATLGGLVKKPLGAAAHSSRGFGRVSNRLDGDDFGELGSPCGIRAGDALSQLDDRLPACYRGRLEFPDHLLESGELVGAVDLDYGQLSLENFAVGDDRTDPRSSGPVGELAEQDRLAQRT